VKSVSTSSVVSIAATADEIGARHLVVDVVHRRVAGAIELVGLHRAQIERAARPAGARPDPRGGAEAPAGRGAAAAQRRRR
jgi:hypothetical protein